MRSHTDVTKANEENDSKVLTDSPPPEVAAATATSPAQSNSAISSGGQTQNPGRLDD